LERNYRLVEDQSDIGGWRIGDAVARVTIAPFCFRICGFQYCGGAPPAP